MKALWFALLLSPVDSLSSSSMGHFVGFDLGTSGARISIIQQDHKQVYSQAMAWGNDDHDNPNAWMNAVNVLLNGAANNLSTQLSLVKSICVSGTSASCLIVDRDNAGQVTRQPRMYNYNVVSSRPDDIIYGVQALERLERHAPDKHTARSPTGSLAKLLAWQAESPLSLTESLCHQADYIAMQFLSDEACGSSRNQRQVSSDWHNCLKLGYDVRQLDWPDWMIMCLNEAGLDATRVLPRSVVSPGQPMGTIRQTMADRLGLPHDVVVVGGTTDSNAAFLAATGFQPTMGTAVTSLGSTLAIKQLCDSYVEDATVGVYSHRFPSVLTRDENVAWLVGGASNVGCAVLRQYNFSNSELDQLSQTIDPSVESPLSYYPLLKPGERFPVADSNKQPIIQPIPNDRGEFLKGILQGISSVERDGYLVLEKLGATPPHTVNTSGGGSRNDMWTRMRQRRLREAFGTEVVVQRAENVEASYGAAILAAAHLL